MRLEDELARFLGRAPASASLSAVTSKVFISYRRDDSPGFAGRIHDRLEPELGCGLLFMDVDNIPLGANFVKVLRDEVAKCGILLAIIGRNWLDASDDEGTPCIENPNDFVRIEISAALQRAIFDLHQALRAKTNVTTKTLLRPSIPGCLCAFLG